jgi:hypothetical protein
VRGDVDCSQGANPVSATDALKILRHVAGLTVVQTEPCDDIGTAGPPVQGNVDCSIGANPVSATDALKILRFVASLQRHADSPLRQHRHIAKLSSREQQRAPIGRPRLTELPVGYPGVVRVAVLAGAARQPGVDRPVRRLGDQAENQAEGERPNGDKGQADREVSGAEVIHAQAPEAREVRQVVASYRRGQGQAEEGRRTPEGSEPDGNPAASMAMPAPSPMIQWSVVSGVWA